MDRWSAKLQRAEHRKAMHDQTDERQEAIQKISQRSEQIYQSLCSTVPETRAIPKNKCTGNDHELIDEAQAFAYNIFHSTDTK